MSDFFNNFWSVYIAAVSLIGILGCFLLLVLVARRKVVPSADNTTGHVWDEDLRELNNPMPKWWMGLFVITVVFSLAYLVAYPGLGSFKGELDWTQYGAYDKEMEKARVDLEPMYAKFVSMPTEEMAKDPQAMAIGERLFMNNCAQCHGSDARGSKSFPNLSDGDWLHGGTPDKIKETITNGRIGVMPPMAAAVGSAEDVRNVAHYVLSLSGSPHDAVKASQGKSKFVACAACHGMDGKGNQALGAPNLTDDIWLHGWGESVIVDMVNHGKMNEMPAQKDKLTEAQIAVLASYVWGLSNASAQK
ncbi:Cbb3-type cytochrome c oxidase subunit CcoP [Comamonas sp. PE63]|jgi:cytochrome c oxidase cbb3-type subunit 3|uniref:Cbb3-type cytochrome c oxidase subunit n=4 Tax=Comamonas TaxID=283 RepID=B7WZN5_COMTK|nr:MULTISPECIES: cytochrome-c oxidase, cbb3-type subunit III [Comamonas]AIJ46385.1 cytochrome CBB3 [Comamonas testosteroni TK102]EED68107.1 cytochrome c oxidase, cbb3-type, subunit III [Comamonas testosteroni KF-1]MBS3017916.1 Cbb3-type cytochrome c oxidase subunit CcoP [Comamonas sp. PE63]MPS88848.1 cytochrome-c oxidase, cbb3-type subunit III [Comamonas sp.]TYK73739.1 cytochrome-c oxidase, cbb3-type subunit III [Comamonas sp. Z3]